VHLSSISGAYRLPNDQFAASRRWSYAGSEANGASRCLQILKGYARCSLGVLLRVGSYLTNVAADGRVIVVGLCTVRVEAPAAELGVRWLTNAAL